MLNIVDLPYRDTIRKVVTDNVYTHVRSKVRRDILESIWENIDPIRWNVMSELYESMQS